MAETKLLMAEMQRLRPDCMAVADVPTLVEIVTALHELHDDGLSHLLPLGLQWDDDRLLNLFDALVADVLPRAGADEQPLVVLGLYDLLRAAMPAVSLPDERRERLCHKATWAMMDAWEADGRPTCTLAAARLAACLAAHLYPDPNWDVEAATALSVLLADWREQSACAAPVAEARAEAIERCALLLPTAMLPRVGVGLQAYSRTPHAAVGAARRLADGLREAAEARLCV